jgi:hypothetical protein
MNDGTFRYDLSKNLNGAEVLQGVNPANPTVELRSPTSALEGGPVDLNLEFASPEVNADPAFTEDASQGVTRRIVAEVEKVLRGAKVGERLVRQLYSLKDSTAIMGQANPDGSIFVNATMVRDEADVVGILNHEIVHAAQCRSVAFCLRPVQAERQGAFGSCHLFPAHAGMNWYRMRRGWRG